MLSPPSLNSAALLILQQTSPLSASMDADKTPGDDLIAAANGVAPHGGASRQARAKISEAMFDSSAFNTTAMKINLMRRLGEELGIPFDDHATQFSFGAAIKEEVAKIRLLETGEKILAKIEKNLGLDKLGITIDQLVNAILDPEGSDAERLDAALRKELGEDLKGRDEDARALRNLLRQDEMGLYSF